MEEQYYVLRKEDIQKDNLFENIDDAKQHATKLAKRYPHIKWYVWNLDGVAITTHVTYEEV